MKNAPDRIAAESAQNSANSTATAPRADVEQAVKDIRAACEVLARLADLNARSALSNGSR